MIIHGYFITNVGNLVNGMIAMTRQCQRLNHLDLSETGCSDSTLTKVSSNLVGLTFLSLLSMEIVCSL